MKLLQNSVVRKYLKGTEETINSAYKLFTEYFHDPERQENIRNCKEEQFQEGFLRELFVKILGYTLKPDPNYNLITEQKNEEDSKKADAAILLNNEVVGVIELKDAKTTNLKNVEGQAFGYKNNHRNAVYVIISNFEKLRFYIDNAVDCLEFNLFTLNKDDFAVMWLCLNFNNIQKNLPKQIKDESVNNEDQITKKLYKDYATFKHDLYDDMLKNNTNYDKLTLFKKSQKLLDRLLFILFAQYRGLLPPNSITITINQWVQLKDDLDENIPLYNRLKKYFGYMNTGHKGKNHDVFAYNGGLFQEDNILDNIKISDDVLYKHMRIIERYDFSSEVDVNILGNIFENSLTEIEEINNAISTNTEQQTIGKRKKDGVYYTPRYITNYIVENTIGKLCVGKKEELGIVEEDYSIDKKRTKAINNKLEQKLIDYRNWLLALTICDPACGSGAFLNAALDFLIEEHRNIDEMRAKIFGGTYQLFENIENAILENNLFGVDINEESVEIAKLSLWLRTAKPNRKLNALNENIKCGNSLISKKEYDNEKAFDWEKEFPNVFKKGGFDVVIGNPPYVKLETIRETSEILSKQNYKTFDKRGDLYVLFVEKGFSLLRDKGYISYIMQNKWMQANYGKYLRSFFLEKELIQLIDFGDIQIFEGATTYPCIFVACNDKPKTDISVSVLKTDRANDFYSNVKETAEIFKKNQFSEDTWVISSQNDSKLLERLKNNNTTLEKFVNGQSYRGVLTGLTDAFLISQTVKEQIISGDVKAKEKIKPFLQGRDLKRYTNATENSYLILFEKGITNSIIKINDEQKALDWFSKTYPSIYKWLEPYADKAKIRTDKGDYWWELRACDYYDIFAKPKIMYQKFQVKPCFIYDEKGLFCNDSMWVIQTDNKALLAILNSKLGWWLVTKYCTQIQNGYQLIWKYFSQIPIPKNLPNELYSLTDNMIILCSDLQKNKESFIKRVTDNFNDIKITGTLENFEELDFKQFLAELKKQKIEISLKQQGEWNDFFDENKIACNAIVEHIKATDDAINKMVYEVYELTDDEIKIIEG